MVGQGPFAVGLLDFVLVGIALDAEDAVVVLALRLFQRVLGLVQQPLVLCQWKKNNLQRTCTSSISFDSAATKQYGFATWILETLTISLKTSSSYSFAAGQLSKTDTSVLFHFVDFLVVAHGVLVLFQVHVALGAPQVGLDVRLVEADGLVAVAQRLFQFVHLRPHAQHRRPVVHLFHPSNNSARFVVHSRIDRVSQKKKGNAMKRESIRRPWRGRRRGWSRAWRWSSGCWRRWPAPTCTCRRPPGSGRSWTTRCPPPFCSWAVSPSAAPTSKKKKHVSLFISALRTTR